MVPKATRGLLKGLMNWLHFNKRTLGEAPGAPDVTADGGICAHGETRHQIEPECSKESERFVCSIPLASTSRPSQTHSGVKPARNTNQIIYLSKENPKSINTCDHRETDCWPQGCAVVLHAAFTYCCIPKQGAVVFKRMMLMWMDGKGGKLFPTCL